MNKRKADRSAGATDPVLPLVGPLGADEEPDGLRLPDMTSLPAQSEFKATAGMPATPSVGNGIIATPPIAPPRPKEDGPEPVVHPVD